MRLAVWSFLLHSKQYKFCLKTYWKNMSHYVYLWYNKHLENLQKYQNKHRVKEGKNGRQF